VPREYKGLPVIASDNGDVRDKELTGDTGDKGLTRKMLVEKE